MMITISGFDSCRKPFMWNELICSDHEERTLCGLVFPQSPPPLLQPAVAAGRQQICKTVQLSEGCGIFPGKDKKKPNEKIVRVEEVINQNVWICFYLLITRCSGSQTGLSRFPNFLLIDDGSV